VVPFHAKEPAGGCTCANEACTQPGDHPRFDLFAQEASRDENTIRSWGDIWPESHIGTITGYASNLVVLEADGAAGGIDSYQALDVVPPNTRTAEEKGKRFRMCFQHPNGELPPKLKVAPGLTLYGDGGAVRLPDETRYLPTSSYTWKAQLPLDPAQLPLSFWDSIGVEINRDFPRTEKAPTISLPFRHHEQRKLQQLARPSWVAYPWAAKGSLTLLVGEREAGKSSVLAGLTSSVLQGEPFARERCRQSGVVYLSEQAPSTFARMFLQQQADDSALRHLSMLYAHDLRSRSWSDIVRGTVERAAKQGAELIVIDSLDTFAAISDPPCELNTARLLEPLYAALSQGMSLVCTASVEARRGLAATAQQLGPLGTVADVLSTVSRRNDEGQVLLRSLSKFDATPDNVVLNVDAEGCDRVDEPYPLFDRPPPRPTAAGSMSGNDAAEKRGSVPAETRGDGGTPRVIALS
jgi:hypothetical protein